MWRILVSDLEIGRAVEVLTKHGIDIKVEAVYFDRGQWFTPYLNDMFEWRTVNKKNDLANAIAQQRDKHD